MFIVTVDHNTGHGIIHGQPILLSESFARVIGLARSLEKGRDPTIGFEFHAADTGMFIFSIKGDQLITKLAHPADREDGLVFARILEKDPERRDVLHWREQWGEGWQELSKKLL